MKLKLLGYSTAITFLLFISYFFITKEITVEEIKKKNTASITELAAAQNHPKALTRLAYMYKEGLNGFFKDVLQAKKLYEQAAEQEDEEAQYSLATFYLLGQEVEQDYLKALHLFERSSPKNHVDSQYELGKMYEKRLGVRQDRAKAKEWYGKVCDGGFQKGCEEYRRINEAGF